MQKPSIGRIVHVIGTDGKNGTDRSPAIITRAWGDHCVNVTIFPDCGEPVSRTSVHLYASEQEAVAQFALAKYLTQQNGSSSFSVCYAYWPSQA